VPDRKDAAINHVQAPGTDATVNARRAEPLRAKLRVRNYPALTLRDRRDRVVRCDLISHTEIKSQHSSFSPPSEQQGVHARAGRELAGAVRDRHEAVARRERPGEV
jgi:hypothetical protein